MSKTDLKKWVRPHILQMKPYAAARLEFEGPASVFLDANENPYGSVSGGSYNRYPDPLQVAVKAKLAELQGLCPDQIFLGNGSDECIDLLIRIGCEPGKDSVLYCPPVFSMYEHAAKASNVGVEEVLLEPETFQLDVPAVLKRIRENENIRILFLCSPNNPTGNLIRVQDIETLLREFPGIVLIDEAYQDFTDAPSWIKRLGEFNNLAVIQTFSKSWGMANARLGMLYADPELVHFLNTIKMPYNVNEHTQQVILQALEHPDKRDAFVRAMNAERVNLEAELDQLPLVIKRYPTDANYILFKVAEADKLYEHLVQHGVIVRNRNKAPLCSGCLRVSVGNREENEKFLNALKNFKPG